MSGTCRREKSIKQIFIGNCWKYLINFITDESKPEIQKSEIVRKLFNLKPPVTSLSLKINSKNYNYKIRHSRGSYPELKVWRKCVFERDGYTCQKCKKTGGRLEAHHVKSWASYPEHRFDINNGQTLCKKCHKKTENYGNKQVGVLK